MSRNVSWPHCTVENSRTVSLTPAFIKWLTAKTQTHFRQFWQNDSIYTCTWNIFRRNSVSNLMEGFLLLPELKWIKSFYGWGKSSNFSVERDDAELQTQHLLPVPCSSETISEPEDKLQRLHPVRGRSHDQSLQHTNVKHGSPVIFISITEQPFCLLALFKRSLSQLCF